MGVCVCVCVCVCERLIEKRYTIALNIVNKKNNSLLKYNKHSTLIKIIKQDKE